MSLDTDIRRPGIRMNIRTRKVEVFEILTHKSTVSQVQIVERAREFPHSPDQNN